VSNAAYLILEIGGNDFFYEYQKGVTPQFVSQNNVSNAVAALVSTVEVKETCSTTCPNKIEINSSSFKI
jgi:hypothetical protein